MPERRIALVVGIDAYARAPLLGCVRDAKAVSALLRRHDDGSPNFDVQEMLAPEEPITAAALRARITELFRQPDCDVALLYFAGHGTENDLGGYLVTPDAMRYDEGVGLFDVLTLANTAPSRERIVILDSCTSGAFGQIPAIGGGSVNLAEGVSVLTASRAGQPSYEAEGRGVFTALLCDALRGGAADVLGDVTSPSIYTYIEQALGPWDQRPLFKAHVSKLTAVRRAAPAVPVVTLRRLTIWFADPNAELALDPSFEHSSDSPDDANVEIFGRLQQCVSAKLVVPVGQRHMYDAAMNGGTCRLTLLGQHYWRLVDTGRL